MGASESENENEMISYIISKIDTKSPPPCQWLVGADFHGIELPQLDFSCGPKDPLPIYTHGEGLGWRV